jgi:hypothetical protein
MHNKYNCNFSSILVLFIALQGHRRQDYSTRFKFFQFHEAPSFFTCTEGQLCLMHISWLQGWSCTAAPAPTSAPLSRGLAACAALPTSCRFNHVLAWTSPVLDIAHVMSPKHRPSYCMARISSANTSADCNCTDKVLIEINQSTRLLLRCQ